MRTNLHALSITIYESPHLATSPLARVVDAGAATAAGVAAAVVNVAAVDDVAATDVVAAIGVVVTAVDVAAPVDAEVVDDIVRTLFDVVAFFSQMRIGGFGYTLQLVVFSVLLRVTQSVRK